MSKLAPTLERIDVVDILRGFALFGVLMVNLLDFSSDAFNPLAEPIHWDAVNQLADWGVKIFFESKFYLLFGFLFGVGFAIQMKRAAAKGQGFTGFYLRRLGILLLIGLAHGILLWRGDILRLYAVFGGVLLLVRHVSTRYLIGGAVVSALISTLMIAVLPTLPAEGTPTVAENLAFYTQSTYLEMVEHRATDPLETIWLVIQLPTVLAVFLLGLALGRSNILENLPAYHPLLRRYLPWALGVGVVGNILSLWAWDAKIYWLSSLGIHVGAPALSFFYASMVILSAEHLRFLAPVGQMALTNYLTHSLVCTTIFYGYGLGLYNQFSPLERIGLAVVIFGGQIILSRFWMQTFRFGPMEWVWRSLTYGEAQPWFRTPRPLSQQQHSTVS